jgi:hypothetical protein
MQGYHFGVLKLDVKTKTATGVEFSSGGSSVIDTGKVRYLSGAVVQYATAGLDLSKRFRVTTRKTFFSVIRKPIWNT